MDYDITLICGCEVVFERPHPETCKCGDEHCRSGYHRMETPCEEHSVRGSGHASPSERRGPEDVPGVF